MGRLTEDMARLRDEISASRNMRFAFIDDLKTKSDDLKTSVANMKADFRKGHDGMACHMRDTLETFASTLKDNVAGMKSGFNEKHSEMAGKLRDELETFASALKDNVADMKFGFNTEHAERAGKLFNTEHAEMAGKLRDELETFASGLKSMVGGLRQEFAADIAGARRAWFGHFHAEPQAKEDECKSEQAYTTPEEAMPDDLTAITGIGPARREQLNAAGIYTFAQLAECTPEQLQEMFREASKPADIENWIVQALRLANKGAGENAK